LFFWSGLGLIVYTYIGYPVIIGTLGRWRRRAVRLEPTDETSRLSVSIVVCVHNEATRLPSRLENLIATHHPVANFEILIVADGCTDSTVAAATAFILTHPMHRVRLFIEPFRRGKAHGLNRAIAQAAGDIVLFADARQRFDSSTVPHLVARFAQADVGAVSGALEIEPSTTTVGSGVDAYWRLEKFIRSSESAPGTCIGCTGAVYAIRRHLFRPIPPDTLLDDVYIPMMILLRGYRVEFEPSAIAWDPQALDPQRERIRKCRTLAGNYQLLFRYPGWLLPWRNRAWWQLLSHKYLRLVAPWALLVTLIANFALGPEGIYGPLLVFQLGLYLLAGCGWAFPKWRAKLLTLPAGFLFLNAMVLEGLIHYLRGPAAAWQTTTATDARSPKP